MPAAAILTVFLIAQDPAPAVPLDTSGFTLPDLSVTAKRQARSLYVRRLERSDGFLYEQIGSSPRVNGLPTARGAGRP